MTASKTSLIKLQRIQNKALRFSYNEHYPYTRNTKSLHELARVEPVNYTTYLTAQTIFAKVQTIQEEGFHDILNNYEANKEHSWFRKTRNIPNRGPPQKIYIKKEKKNRSRKLNGERKK